MQNHGLGAIPVVRIGLKADELAGSPRHVVLRLTE
jgi:hypothetical protein